MTCNTHKIIFPKNPVNIDKTSRWIHKGETQVNMTFDDPAVCNKDQAEQGKINTTVEQACPGITQGKDVFICSLLFFMALII